MCMTSICPDETTAGDLDAWRAWNEAAKKLSFRLRSNERKTIMIVRNNNENRQKTNAKYFLVECDELTSVQEKTMSKKQTIHSQPKKTAPQFRSAHRLFNIFRRWFRSFFFVDCPLRGRLACDKNSAIVRYGAYDGQKNSPSKSIVADEALQQKLIDIALKKWTQKKICLMLCSVFTVHANAATNSIENSWAHTLSACRGISEILRTFSFSSGFSDAAIPFYSLRMGNSLWDFGQYIHNLVWQLFHLFCAR